MVDLIARLPKTHHMQEAIESYQGEKLKLGVSTDEPATAENSVNITRVIAQRSNDV